MLPFCLFRLLSKYFSPWPIHSLAHLGSVYSWMFATGLHKGGKERACILFTSHLPPRTNPRYSRQASSRNNTPSCREEFHAHNLIRTTQPSTTCDSQWMLSIRVSQSTAITFKVIGFVELFKREKPSSESLLRSAPSPAQWKKTV